MTDENPGGVSRWVDAAGKISLGGFTYSVGATYAGEPVEVIVAGGLVDILHAGVVIATHAQRLREDQADRTPRARVAFNPAQAQASVGTSDSATRNRASCLSRSKPSAAAARKPGSASRSGSG